MSFNIQLELLQSTLFCPWCYKNIPRGNLHEHCAGRAHRKAIEQFEFEQAEILEKDEFFCQQCSKNVSPSWPNAMQHVQGMRHFKLASDELQRQMSRAREPAVDPEVAQIVNTGECSVCRKLVARHVAVATEHIAGAAHNLFKTLASADWKNGLAQLQKSAEGLEMAVIVGDQRARNHIITVELGVPLSVTLKLSNNAQKVHMLRRILVIPPAKAQTLGLTLRMASQLSLPAGYYTIFEKVINLPANALDQLGRHEVLFAFSFTKALLLQTVTVSVVSKGSVSIADEQARLSQNVFVPQPKRNPSEVYHLAQKLDFVPGERLAAEVNAESLYVRGLPFFDLRDPLPPRAAYLKALQPRLAIGTYANRFSALLQLEEIQMNIDILSYDRESTLSTTSQRPGLLRLKVDGLAESRPSVQKGDSILASIRPIGPGSRPRGVFQGFVHHVEMEYVFLKFHKDFHAAHIAGQNYFIRFRFNRLPIRRMHMGMQDLVSTGAQARFFSEVAVSSSSSRAASSSSSSSASTYVFSGPSLLVTNSPDAADAWIQREIHSKKIKAIGLDTESALVYGSPNQLTIIQIATCSAVLVYRFFGSCGDLPERLFAVLQTDCIIKYSVGKEDDLMDLMEFEDGVSLDDFVDLQAKEWGGRLPDKKLKGTQQLADEYAPALKFVKNKSMQTSEWSQWPLTPMQQEYAANDAIIALAIGSKIAAKKAGQPPQLPTALVKYSAGAIGASSSSSSSSSSPALSFTSKNLNAIQREAVVKMIQGDYHPRPFLLFGPPGTGKTTVLVEAIQQLLKTSVRILAVAPSNSAADLFIERLSNLGKDEMYRLNALGRSVSETPDGIKKYSSSVGDTFKLISRESLLKFRVVVSTAISASNLTGLGCKPGDFTHIVCDENGHATECESMAAIGGLIDPTKTRVILGGDPKQLGPVVRSPDAEKGGLGVSLLERLMQPYAAGPDDDGRETNSKSDRCMTKLLYNYRSHPAILATPNALFYSNELIPAADELVRRSLCAWPLFPQKDFPLLFHHINGKEQREQCSPSWCNLDEVSLILTYVRQLLEWKQSGLLPRDIGIISPYHRQVQHIRNSLHTLFGQMGRDAEWRDLKVGSCEEFQGQERRVILISTVRSQMLSLESFDVKFQLGFVHQPKRMNVALTRAKQALILVGNGEVLKTDANWKRVLLHCQTNGAVRGEFKIATNSAAAGAASSSSSSSSAVGEDGDFVSGLEHLISLKQLAERSDAQAADARAAAMEGDDEDGWQLVPISDKPWKASD